jgi:branched-chain amino acid transport system permease protein/neutral amino acid transport system permease protein
VHNVVAAVGFGLVIASVLSIAALGFDLTFAVSRTLNIGFIAFMLIGQFTAFGLQHISANLWLVGIGASLVSAVCAVTVYRCLVAPFLRRGAEPFVVVLVLFAFYTLASASFSAAFGTRGRSLKSADWLRHPVHVGAMLFTTSQVIVLVLAAVLVLAIDASLRYTRLGRDIRAISDDRDLAVIRGIQVDRITVMTWAASGFLGGLAGVFLAIIQSSFSSLSDAPYFVLVTAAAFLGGAGRPYGAFAGALIVGAVTQVSAVWIPPNLSPLIAFLALIATIMFRPQGLLGAATEEFRP